MELRKRCWESRSLREELRSFFRSSKLFLPSIMVNNVLLSIPISLQNFFITFSNFIIFRICSLCTPSVSTFLLEKGDFCSCAL